MLLVIDVVNVILASVIMLALGGIFAVILAFLGNKLKVKRDERIDEVVKRLTGANCGGCGYAGCDAFATALCEGKAKLSDCPSTPADKKEEIAELLGISDDSGEPTVAVVKCNGGNSCKDKYEYQGYGDCRSVQLLAGGRKECPVGCMGMGSCTDACPVYAAEVGADGYAVIDGSKCTSCGACMSACPKGLIERIPKSAKVYAACSNNCKGKDVRGICEHGCIGCTMCAKVCEGGAITMENNLPKFDYSKCTACFKCVEKCPTHVIKRILRESD